MLAKSIQSCPTLCDPMDCSPPAPLSMGFSRQEHWSGLPCPPPGDLPNPGIKLTSPALAGGFFTASTTWETLKEILMILQFLLLENGGTSLEVQRLGLIAGGAAPIHGQGTKILHAAQ